MTDTNASLKACANTDRELWREREGDYYADSIHVTAQGGIGIDCGGTVIVKPLREWHQLATRTPPESSEPTEEGLGALTGSKATPEAPAGLRPTGYDPARVTALEKIIRDTLWMARRYADGRMTYAVEMFNDAARLAVSLGVLRAVDVGVAADGMIAIATETRRAETSSGSVEDEGAGRQASPGKGRP